MSSFERNISRERAKREFREWKKKFPAAAKHTSFARFYAFFKDGLTERSKTPVKYKGRSEGATTLASMAVESAETDISDFMVTEVFEED